jgi:hypothetical protein
MTCEQDSQGWAYAASVKCHDCGVVVPCGPQGITQPHECDSTDIRVQQASLAAWEDGYRFAIQNSSDELVQADAANFGTGWIKFVRQGGVVVETEDPGPYTEQETTK